MLSSFFAERPDQDITAALLKHIPPQVVVAHRRNQQDATPWRTRGKTLYHSTPVILCLIAITQDQLQNGSATPSGTPLAMT